MATNLTRTGEAVTPSLAIAMAIVPALPRPLLARFVALAIERLDELDGDPDLEDKLLFRKFAPFAAAGSKLSALLRRVILISEAAFRSAFNFQSIRLRAVNNRKDGDPDLEDENCDGDPLDLGELDEGTFLAPPRYGIDQSKGPVNEVEAHRDYMRSLRA